MKEDEGYKPATLFKKYKTDNSKAIASILSLNTIADTIGAAGVGQQSSIVFGSEWFGLVSTITQGNQLSILLSPLIRWRSALRSSWDSWTTLRNTVMASILSWRVCMS